MAEAVGVALGVLTLAGTLRDCVELFSYFEAIKKFGVDLELLVARLDIQKALLVQWADRVHLFDYECDRRLNNPTTKHAVAKALAGIQQLLSQSGKFKDRYGLREHDLNDDVPTQTLVPHHSMAENRSRSLLEACQDISLRVKRRKLETPLRCKVRWVIHDHVKFGTLIDTLATFVTNLNELLPASTDCALDHTMIATDLHQVKATGYLKTIRDAANGREHAVASAAEHDLTTRCEEAVLRCLRFRVMTDREDAIHEPCPQTLEWLVDPPDDQRDQMRWDDFAQWLEVGSNIYWLCGKPGSGKTTAMKHIFNHTLTLKRLSTWTGSKPLVLGKFFFWYGGAVLQRTLQGLQRAVLLTILKSARCLIPKLLPNTWEEFYGKTPSQLDPPTAAELLGAFQALINLELQTKFCFFIDGIDEYEGSYRDATEFLKRLVRNTSFKVVAASRPIAACWDAFASMPKLRMQDLTGPDIREYIRRTVAQHPYMVTLDEEHSGEVSDMLDDLAKDADGVFIWVVLACRIVMDGFANNDRLSEIRRSIDELPPELSDLFQYMIGKIEPKYRLQAAQLLRIQLRHMGDRQKHRLKALGVALAERHDFSWTLVPPDENFSREGRFQICNLLEGRLRSRCWGLLEFAEPLFEVSDMDVSSKHEVVFMHRTVYEYLKTPGVLEHPSLQTSASFSVDAALACVWMHSATQIKGFDPVREYGLNMVKYGQLAEKSGRCLVSVLERFIEMSFSEIVARDLGGFAIDTSRIDKGWQLTLMLAIEMGFVQTVRETQRSRGRPLATMDLFSKPLLHAVRKPLLNRRLNSTFGISEPLICYLLANGCDPNEPAGADIHCPMPQTPWTLWLRSENMVNAVDGHAMLQTARIYAAFFKAGADMSLRQFSIIKHMQSTHHVISHSHLDNQLASDEEHAAAQEACQIYETLISQAQEQQARTPRSRYRTAQDDMQDVSITGDSHVPEDSHFIVDFERDGNEAEDFRQYDPGSDRTDREFWVPTDDVGYRPRNSVAVEPDRETLVSS